MSDDELKIKLAKMTAAQKRTYLAAKKRKAQLNRSMCFDVANPLSRANGKQEDIHKDVNSLYKIVRAGNQCLAEGTLVMTPIGPVPIEDISIGDTVFDEFGKEQNVVNWFNQGEQECEDLTVNRKVVATCSTNHKWWTTTAKATAPRKRKTSELSKGTKIERVHVPIPAGHVHEPHAYAIGALLGDGCGKESGYRKDIRISSENSDIPTEVQRVLGGKLDVRKQHANNFTWQLTGTESDHCNHYRDWMHDRYAHEKIVDLDVIKSWNRETCLAYLAGLVDSDGSVYARRDGGVCINIAMQAKPVIESAQYLLLSLFQYDASIYSDDRAKYKNGAVSYLTVSNSYYSEKILRELLPYSVCKRKRWKPEYTELKTPRFVPERQGVIKVPVGKKPCYDITVDGENNVFLLANGLVTSNSGKTQTMVRDYAWKLAGNHPHWKRRTGKECPSCKSKNTVSINPAVRSYKCGECPHKWRSWEGDKIIMLCVMQTGKQIEDMWDSRFKPFFHDTEIKVKKEGGALQHVTHLETGNRIYFFSHDNATEVRKRVQYFAAHDVWIDEMPGHYKVYEELQRRCDAKKGQFTATLTPKVTNIAVKNFIDKMSPTLTNLIRMSKFDNPIYAGDEEEELAKIAHLPEQERNSILFGDWIFVNDLRLSLNQDKVLPLPDHYSKHWDHVECVDPASSGKVGFVMFAKDPSDIDTWWVVMATHIKGDAASLLLKESIPKLTDGYNIVLRVVDPHENWFVKEAIIQEKTYLSPFDKTHRRKELIEKGGESLVNPKHFIAEGACAQLEEELNTAEDNPANPGTIKNSTKYHCIDAWVYGLDLLPVYATPPAPRTIMQERRQSWVEQRDNKPQQDNIPEPSAIQQLKNKNVWNRKSTRHSRRR